MDMQMAYVTGDHGLALLEDHLERTLAAPARNDNVGIALLEEVIRDGHPWSLYFVEQAPDL
jgi:hypothetical protein